LQQQTVTTELEHRADESIEDGHGVSLQRTNVDDLNLGNEVHFPSLPQEEQRIALIEEVLEALPALREQVDDGSAQKEAASNAHFHVDLLHIASREVLGGQLAAGLDLRVDGQSRDGGATHHAKGPVLQCHGQKGVVLADEIARALVPDALDGRRKKERDVEGVSRLEPERRRDAIFRDREGDVGFYSESRIGRGPTLRRGPAGSQPRLRLLRFPACAMCGSNRARTLSLAILPDAVEQRTTVMLA
jgi:hypothetical protein